MGILLDSNGIQTFLAPGRVVSTHRKKVQIARRKVQTVRSTIKTPTQTVKTLTIKTHTQTVQIVRLHKISMQLDIMSEQPNILPGETDKFSRHHQHIQSRQPNRQSRYLHGPKTKINIETANQTENINTQIDSPNSQQNGWALKLHHGQPQRPLRHLERGIHSLHS